MTGLSPCCGDVFRGRGRCAHCPVPTTGRPSVTDLSAGSNMAWGAQDGASHSCHCIGCCPKCGSCRTWPGHTDEWCALLVKQAAERAEARTGGHQ